MIYINKLLIKGCIKTSIGSSKNIPLPQNISIESSENERSSANLYQRMAMDKNANRDLICKKCEQIFCQFDSLHEHSKKQEVYRCRFLFVNKLENVTILSENEKKLIICSGCKLFIGTASQKDEKCSCRAKVNGIFKISKKMVHLKE